MVNEEQPDGLAEAVRALARAVTPVETGAEDAAGTYVESLTEAMMGVTGGLVRIAEAINDLADAMRERGD
jgi:hypothetical protein